MSKRIRRRAWQCTLAGLILAGWAGAVVWKTFVPMYQASAWLEIKAQAPFIIEQQSQSPVFEETQLQIMRSPVVLSQVANIPEIAALPEVQEWSSPLDWLSKAMKVEHLRPSELWEISVKSRDGATAAMVANEIMKAYMNLHLK